MNTPKDLKESLFARLKQDGADTFSRALEALCDGAYIASIQKDLPAIDQLTVEDLYHDLMRLDAQAQELIRKHRALSTTALAAVLALKAGANKNKL